MKTKKCNRCGESKPLNGFYKNKQTVDGRYGACKGCRKVWQQEYQKRNNERIVAVHRAYRERQPTGIYTITNTITKRVYVGQSTMILQRWLDHKKRLETHRHENKKLQEDYIKHGEIFEYKIVKELPRNTDLETLLQEESITIQNHVDKDIDLYNKTMTIIKKDKK
jgi:hypothetical protein